MHYLPATPPRDVSWYGAPQEHGARCDICPLRGSVFVPYVPPPKGRKPRLVLVGEGPGRKEEAERTPFVGITGRQLTSVLEEVGFSRQEAWLTNAALCASDDDRENVRAAECCAPRLLRELSEIPADVPIVPLGKQAVKSVLGVNSILLARGFVWTARDLEDPLKAAQANAKKLLAEKGRKRQLVKLQDAELRLEVLTERHKLAGRTVLPTLHPTFAFIHNELWAPIFELDMRRAARWIRGELTHAMLADTIFRVDSIAKLKKKPRTFIVTDSIADLEAASLILGNEVGCDIETERIKPLSPLKARILCVQLSDGKRSVVIAPWDPKVHPAALDAFLKGRTAVFHNGFCFDSVALERDGVTFEGVQIEDTLTAHHAFASCYPQKLDHVVATFLDSSPWKIRHGVRGAEEKGLTPKADADDLFEYGATDAVVTILAWQAMQRDLDRERAVYEHDKRRSILYKSLQVTGYPVDRRRQRLLSKKLKRRGAALAGRLKKLSRRKDFRPSRLSDVRRALFKTMKAPLLNPTPTGLASTSNATLEALREGAGTRVARFCETLLNWRFTLKAKGTYVDTVPVHADGHAHYNFKPFGVITGRPASRILSAPRWSKETPERFREIFYAPKGYSLVYFDLAQAEARFAANLSADRNFIEACAKDIHTKNALLLFPDAKEALERDPKGKHCPRHSEGGSSSAACNCGKPFRDVTKNAGFAIIYQAHPSKVFAYLRSQGFPVQMDHVEAMFDAMRGKYYEHDKWVKDMLRFATENGYLRTALVGRIIRLGFHPKPTDVSNVPIQSGIADVMDTRLLDQILPRIPGEAKMVMHHYDSATFFTRNCDVEKVQVVIEDVWKAPVQLKQSIVCRQDCEFVLPAETKVGRRWSDF